MYDDYMQARWTYVGGGIIIKYRHNNVLMYIMMNFRSLIINKFIQNTN
jgi:hypothetical protein